MRNVHIKYKPRAWSMGVGGFSAARGLHVGFVRFKVGLGLVLPPQEINVLLEL